MRISDPRCSAAAAGGTGWGVGSRRLRKAIGSAQRRAIPLPPGAGSDSPPRSVGHGEGGTVASEL